MTTASHARMKIERLISILETFFTLRAPSLDSSVAMTWVGLVMPLIAIGLPLTVKLCTILACLDQGRTRPCRGGDVRA